MGFIIDITNRLFSAAFLPFAGMRPDYALLAISVITGVAMFYLYKWTSDQSALKKAQDRAKAHILEIQLYKNDLYVMLRALSRVFVRNMAYLRLLFIPALAMMFIVAVIVIQCYPRFEFRPVRPGESFLLKAAVKEGGAGPGSMGLTLPEGVAAEAGPLVIPSLNEVDWRLRAASPGEYDIKVIAGGEERTRRLIVGDGLRGVSPKAAPLSFGNYIENPLETPLPGGSVFGEIVIVYPERELGSPLMLGMGWLVYFFVVSFAVALMVKFVTRAH